MGDNVFDVLLQMLAKRNHLCLVLDEKERLLGMVTLQEVFEMLINEGD